MPNDTTPNTPPELEDEFTLPDLGLDLRLADPGSPETPDTPPVTLPPRKVHHAQGPNPRALGGFGFVRTRQPRAPKALKVWGRDRAYPHPLDPYIGVVTINLTPAIRRAGLIKRDGTPNLAAFQATTGMSYDKCYQLLRRPDTIRGLSITTLARVCEALHCQPGDLLTYTPRIPGSDH